MAVDTRQDEATRPIAEQESYRLLIEAAKDYAIFMLSPSGHITTWNIGAQRIQGYQANEILGKHFSCFYLDSTPQDIDSRLQTAQNEENLAEEGWRVRKNGIHFWANTLITPLYSTSHEIMGYSMVIRNLSEQKQAEEKVNQSFKERQDIKFALDQSTFVAITNNQGVITFVNDAFCRISQFSSSELVGKTHRIINSGYHPLEFFKSMWSTIGHGHVWKGEIKNRAKDGSFYWVDTTITPFLDEKTGKPYQYIAIRHDITARKLLELQLAEAKEIAENANKQKSLFLTNMSHELRTPLNAVISYSQMMKQGIAGSITEKQHKYAHNIEISGKHLLAIVNDILDIAKIEAGKIKLAIEPIQLIRLLQELEDILSEFSERQNVHLKFEVDPNLSTITGDPIRLRQIFFNLISNAIKFNTEDGHVNVRVFLEDGGQWFIGEVQDTGIGIPTDKLEELFTEFYQVDASASRTHEGTGLGLALTRHLVHLHGGEISVKSEIDNGSTFRFRIPIQPK